LPRRRFTPPRNEGVCRLGRRGKSRKTDGNKEGLREETRIPQEEVMPENIKDRFTKRCAEIGFLPAFFEMQDELNAQVFQGLTATQRKIILKSAITHLALGFVHVVKQFGDEEEKALLKKKNG